MNAMMILLPKERYAFLSNREGGNGRIDNTLHDNKLNRAYIFEYKYTKSDILSEIKSLAKDGL